MVPQASSPACRQDMRMKICVCGSSLHAHPGVPAERAPGNEAIIFLRYRLCQSKGRNKAATTPGGIWDGEPSLPLAPGALC